MAMVFDFWLPLPETLTSLPPETGCTAVAWLHVVDCVRQVIEGESLESRLEGLRKLGFRGPKPRTTCWAGAVPFGPKDEKNPRAKSREGGGLQAAVSRDGSGWNGVAVSLEKEAKVGLHRCGRRKIRLDRVSFISLSLLREAPRVELEFHRFSG